MKKKILYLILVLALGFLGGVAADWLLPYLGIIDSNSTTIINTTEQVIITENEAMQQAVDKISPALVAVEVYNKKTLLHQGTGFILTSDGVVVTAADLLADTYDEIVVRQAGWSKKATFYKQDKAANLALIKIDNGNLSVVTMVSLEDIRLGEVIILVGAEAVSANDAVYQFMNVGTVRSIKQDTLAVNLAEESPLANGGPLVNVRGEVIGLNLIDKQGLVKTVPVSVIRKVLND